MPHTSPQSKKGALERVTNIDVWMDRRRKEDNRLYERYGKPLEKEHWGELVAIGPDGTVLFDEDSDELFTDAIDRFGSGNFAFTRIGERALGQWLAL